MGLCSIVLPDVLSVFQHGQTYGAFLIHICLFFLTNLQLQGLSLLAGYRETKVESVQHSKNVFLLVYVRMLAVPPSCICVER